MKKEDIILIAEDDMGHAGLIMKNLKNSTIKNKMLHFRNGKEVLNFLFKKREMPYKEENESYILLLDIRMPKIDGIEVLRQIKLSNELSEIPVVIVTTTDNPRTIKECQELGCNQYVVKPINYDNFVETINKLGKYLKTLMSPN